MIKQQKSERDLLMTSVNDAMSSRINALRPVVFQAGGSLFQPSLYMKFTAQLTPKTPEAREEKGKGQPTVSGFPLCVGRASCATISSLNASSISRSRRFPVFR